MFFISKKDKITEIPLKYYNFLIENFRYWEFELCKGFYDLVFHEGNFIFSQRKTHLRVSG